MTKHFKALFLGASLAFTLTSCAPNPYFIQAVVILGGYAVRTAIAEVIEQAVDHIFDRLFDRAADKTAGAVPIAPLAGNPNMGRKIGAHQYLIEGERNGRKETITLEIPTEKVLFIRADSGSAWELTPGSKQLILERMDIAGAQLSLRNLGYDPSDIDGILGKKTKRALRAFQRAHELLPTGELNDLTRQLLFMR